MGETIKIYEKGAGKLSSVSVYAVTDQGLKFIWVQIKC